MCCLCRRFARLSLDPAKVKVHSGLLNHMEVIKGAPEEGALAAPKSVNGRRNSWSNNTVVGQYREDIVRILGDTFRERQISMGSEWKDDEEEPQGEESASERRKRQTTETIAISLGPDAGEWAASWAKEGTLLVLRIHSSTRCLRLFSLRYQTRRLFLTRVNIASPMPPFLLPLLPSAPPLAQRHATPLPATWGSR